MTTIANCSDMTEALRLQMILKSTGILSFIPDETMATFAPFHFLTNSGVRLQVEDEQAPEARRILAERVT